MSVFMFWLWWIKSHSFANFFLNVTKSLWTGIQNHKKCVLPFHENYNQITIFALAMTVALSSESIVTHWGRVTHICVGNLSVIGSDNGLLPGRHQAIIWTSAGILLFGPLGTIFSEIVSEIYTFSLKKMHLKMASGKWRPCCLGLNVLIHVEFSQQLSTLISLVKWVPSWSL